MIKFWQLDSKKSLRKSTQVILREEYPDLMHSKKTLIVEKCISYLSAKQNWWIVPPIVIAIYSFFTLINIPFVAFVSIDEATANILIDQRTSNVATIISMTLAVVGLLLGNLAIKEPVTYNLMFVRSRVHLIVTYTLSTIFCLIITSTLRRSAPDGYEYLYPRAVLAGTYMVISILFLIGYLFRTVMLFSNSNALQQVLKSEFYAEVKKNIQLHLLNKLSRDKFRTLMEQMGYNEVNFWSQISNSTITEDEDVQVDIFENDKLVYDINLVDLKAQLIKCDPSIDKEYHLFGLNENFSNSTSYIFTNGSATDGTFNKIKLGKYLAVRKSSEILLPSFEFAKYFEGKLEEYSEQGKNRKVNEILMLFGDIYELEMKYT